MQTADWYYDFISPYAYLSFASLDDFSESLEIKYRPVVFAGLLNHWENKGPAEIASKREWTYRQCVWRAQERGIPFRAPASHPFNPLPYLRLAIAAGNTHDVIDTIFKALWSTGVDASDPELVNTLAKQLGVDVKRIRDSDVKEMLQSETQQAIQQGVFGVPTMVVNEQRFWGDDAHGFINAYVSNPEILSTPEMTRIQNLPIGAKRKEVK